MKKEINLNRKRSPIWKVPKEEFINAVKSSNTLTEALSYFGIEMVGRNGKTLKDRIEYENIDISHIEQYRKELNKSLINRVHKKNTIPIEELLVISDKYIHSSKLKKRLLKEGLLEEKCYSCGIGPEWKGKYLSLQLEHKNGNRLDNRLKNLCLLCPNCHSQTDTYTGKNKRIIYNCTNCNKEITKASKKGYCSDCLSEVKIIHTKVNSIPKKEELEQKLIKEQIPFIKLGKEYGVSDNAIRKWCKKLGLPHTKQLIEEYTKENYPHHCGVCGKEICNEHPTKEKLSELLLEQNLTLSEVGNNFDVHRNIVIDWCRKYSLPGSTADIGEYKKKKELILTNIKKKH